jgi:2-dehydro-3-deoxygluconokinase
MIMPIELKKNARYALLVPTSMGVRITPTDSQPVHVSRAFTMQVTSAETNVASPVAYLGLPVKVLTALVNESPIARMISDNLAGRHMDVEALRVDQADPWGARHQINIADSGFGARGPRVHNDRAGEVGRELGPGDFDLERIFGEEGVQIVHLSGLIAALSESTTDLCLAIARTARKHGTIVSFDLNHRASFWAGREKELSAAFHEIASLADILIGNEEDFQLCLGLEGPEAGGRDLSAKLEGFRGMIDVTARRYPGAKLFATTLREVVDAGEHLWGAVIREGQAWHVAEPRPIRVYDRIGGGDGFVGGLLYGVLREWGPEKALQFGWAMGALAVTSDTDYAQPLSEEMVWSIWAKDARVKR